MKIEINTPCEIEVSDYHEFEEIEQVLRQLNSRFRVCETGFDESSHLYVGKIYLKEEKRHECR